MTQNCAPTELETSAVQQAAAFNNSGPNTPNSQAEEEPLYVNAKQYNRILKRRQARNKLENEGRIPKVRMVMMFYYCELEDLLYKKIFKYNVKIRLIAHYV